MKIEGHASSGDRACAGDDRTGKRKSLGLWGDLEEETTTSMSKETSTSMAPRST